MKRFSELIPTTKLSMRSALLVLLLPLSQSVFADVLKPDCNAEKAVKNAVTKATVGVGGRCKPGDGVKDAVDDKVDGVKDSVDDKVDGVKDSVDDKFDDAKPDNKLADKALDAAKPDDKDKGAVKKVIKKDIE